MASYRITYDQTRSDAPRTPTEDITADGWQDVEGGEWFDFYVKQPSRNNSGTWKDRILRVRASHVMRIERVEG